MAVEKAKDVFSKGYKFLTLGGETGDNIIYYPEITPNGDMFFIRMDNI